MVVRFEDALHCCARPGPRVNGCGCSACPAGLCCKSGFSLTNSVFQMAVALGTAELVRLKRDLLIAVSVEGSGNALDHAGLQRLGTAEFADAFLVLARGEVARAGGAVLHLAVGREAEALLRAFVCLLLGHNRVPNRVVNFAFGGIHQFSNFGAGWKG